MARQKRYIDTNVYDEAKKRIHHILDTFDSYVVCFSGGKDSLAVVELSREVYQERGITKPLDVVFRDEELIPSSVINLVDEYRQKDWIKMLWFAVPLRSVIHVMGVNSEYVQWDANREHVRSMPPWAIQADPGMVFDQYTMDAYTAQFYKGRIALVNGIRADESLVRFRASVNKLNENYITAPPKMGLGHRQPKNVRLCKPIFDWRENDVFKYFYDNKIKYSPLYDKQMLAGQGLRVSTPLHAEAAKKFHKIRATDPVFYQAVVNVFPEMKTHERYHLSMDKKGMKEKYGASFDTILEYIDKVILDPKEHAKAIMRFKSVKKRAQLMPKSYPTDHIFLQFASGAYKREIMPKG